MRLVCAWCGTAIERPGYSQTVEPETSHGMCPICSEALVSQERGATLQQHLDSIPIPILLINDGNSVVTMNAKACDILGRETGETHTPLFGKVFDCVHSRSAEGCGRTIHCSGCVIRRSVTMTFNTGESQVLVPATLSLASLDQISEAVTAITTVKIGGLVLLHME
jgi:PAS domain